MKQPELTKRIVLTRFWVGDIVYHALSGERGIVINVFLMSDRLVPRYDVCFPDRETDVCDEMELSSEQVFDTVEAKEEEKEE